MLWLAISADNQPVGLALATVDINDKSAMLAELDVLPDHQQKGLGRALVQTVIKWAQSEGFKSLSLTTFSNVPWNAPFYKKLGFRYLLEKQLTATLITILNKEEEIGLKNRVAMQINF